MIRRPSLLLFLLLAFSTLGFAQPGPPIQVLLLTGTNDHDWQFTSENYKTFLEQTLRFQVTVTTTPAEVLADPAEIAKYQAFFLDYNGPRWGEAAEANFVKAIRDEGKGLVVTHASSSAFKGWQEYEQMLGYVARDGAGQGKVHDFDVQVVDHNHPVSAQLLPLSGHQDELYHGMTRVPDARLRVLLGAHSSKESGGTGKREPLVLIGQYGKGRVFHSMLGHVWPGRPETRSSVETPAFKFLISRGTEWAAGERVLIPARAFGVKARFSMQQRPRDPWVFRCVLDGRPRVVS